MTADGHAEQLNRPELDPPDGICGVPHPLLEEIRCDRLKGHTGRLSLSP